MKILKENIYSLDSIELLMLSLNVDGNPKSNVERGEFYDQYSGTILGLAGKETQ